MHGFVSGSINGFGIVGAGKPQGASYPTNFWKYNDATSTWTALPNHPESGRVYATGFVIGSRLYMGTGFNGAQLQDFWEFDMFPMGKVYATPSLPVPMAEMSDGVWKKNNSIIHAVNATQLSFGVAYPKNNIDIVAGGARTGAHSQGIPFYITGTDTSDPIAEFKSNTGSLGVGLAQTSIYAAGSAADQDLSMKAKGVSGTLNFVTNGINRLRILGNGNVGIGTTTPTNKLDITTATRSGTHGSLLSMYVTGALTDAGSGFEIRHTDGTQGVGIGRNTIYAAGSNASQNLSISAKGPAGELILNTNATERIHISANGNVGIGITPANRMDIANATRTGTHNTSLPLYVTGSLTDAGNGFEIKHNDGTQGIGIGRNTIYAAGSNADQNLSLTAKGTGGVLAFYTNSVNRLWIAANGNIGIGLSSVNNKLDIATATRTGTHATGVPLYITGDIADANGVEIRHTNGTQGVGIGYNTLYAAGSNANQDLSLQSKGTTASVRFVTNAAERVRINGSGFIGIGTTNPFGPIHLASSAGNRKIILYSDFNNDHQFIGFGVNGDGSLRYQTAFNVNDHIFYTGINATESDELFRIRSINGNIALKGLIETEAYITPAFINGFTDYAAVEYADPGYFKDKMGIVRLHGVVNQAGNPDDLVMFVLPVGYRPLKRTIFSVVNMNVPCRIDVHADGSVMVMDGNTGWFSLDGIEFKAEQ